MVWYVLGGLIGLIFFKRKYHLSFWQAVSSGVIFAFGLYFSYSAMIGVLSLILGLEKYMDTTLLATFLHIILAFLSFAVIKGLKNRGLAKTSSKRNTSDKYSGDYSSSVDNNRPEAGEIIETNVVGVTFERRQNLIKTLRLGQPIRVIREPENNFDFNAIKIVNEDNKSIGYINRNLADIIAPIIDRSNNKTTIYGRISSIYQVKDEPSITGVKIRFRLPDRDHMNPTY